MEWLSKFKNLKSNSLYSIDKINLWLLKYSDSYKKTIHFIESKKEEFELEDASSVWLPPIKEPISNSEKKFIILYGVLNTISEFHRNEKYFEQEMTEYHKIKHSKSDLKKWVAKNETLGAEKYVCFLIDYLDYSENPVHLNIYLNTLNELNIYIDRQEFKNTIDFLEIFNELYWVQEILPESLERIRIEMKKIKTTANTSYNLCLHSN
jgi:hypothetical protein